MKKILLLLGFLLFLSFQSCFAFSPKSACGYLNSISGLSTSGYKYDGYEYYCCSPYKILDGNRSNLAYYVDGTQNSAKRVYLVLNFYYGSNKKVLHNSLIEASKLLSKKSINYNLPQSIITNLQNGTPGIWKHGANTIEITKEVFTSGKGYEVHFIIKG